MNTTNELLAALSPVIAALRQLRVRHYVGGSVASSYHGAMRSTMDVDIVCELETANIPSFIQLLGNDYYVNESAARNAVVDSTCFNAIHLPTSFKVDVFISRRRPFDLEAMRRATIARLGDGSLKEVPIASAEDVVISKVEWFRLGGEVSERQWDDITRVMKVLGDTADLGYLARAAESVGVSDLLTRLLSQR